MSVVHEPRTNPKEWCERCGMNVFRGHRCRRALKRRSVAWQDRAACVGVDIGAFYNDRPGPNPIKDLCKDCPVRIACAEYAIANNESHGIWGGLSPRERIAIRRRRAA